MRHYSYYAPYSTHSSAPYNVTHTVFIPLYMEYFHECLLVILGIHFDVIALYCVILPGGFVILSSYPHVFSIAVSHAKSGLGAMDKA